MARKVIFTPQSREDLKEIVTWIAKDDQAAALRIGNWLIGEAESLSPHPELGSRVARRKGVRRLVCRSWLIFYRVAQAEGGVIEILRFWPAARDGEQLHLE